MPEATLTPRVRLEAGGLVPVSADVGADLPVDTVDARGYTSPALPGRTVVRLVPDAVARGIDTEMELLGFAMTRHGDDLAKQRRRALGFPGHALVIDPERARYALDVMREFKAHAKRIQSKPGHAKEGFDEIGLRLSRQVPHFLPSYYEEVARAFATAGNLTYAASAFDKARTAEREFGLEVDEERRAEAFLEFALLGALTVKSIQAYGKELQRIAGAEKAYERLYMLAVRRTLGGVAPWASLPKDLRTLAKAAKKKVDEEDLRFLREVSSASSLKRAPASFWTEYQDTWLALAKAEPVIRARLLDLFPSGGKTRHAWRNTDDGFADAWMTLLGESGALDVLWSDGAADAMPSGGRAAWLGRLQAWTMWGDGWVLQIVRRAAGKLRADGVPVPVSNGNWYKPLDLDLLDLLIELRVPWKLEAGHSRVDLEKWAALIDDEPRLGFPGERRPRDPVHAVTEPTIRALLANALDGVFGKPDFEAKAAAMRGMADLRRQWLEERIAEVGAPGLAATLHALDRLESATTSDHFVEFPAAAAALKAASVAPALARTLQTGILEELHWPAFDEAATLLELDKPDAVATSRVQWPYLVLSTPRKLAVLAHDRVALQHDLKHGDGKTHPNVVLYVGGKAVVKFHYWNKGQTIDLAYWTDAPNDTFQAESSWYNAALFPLELPDGAMIFGTTKYTAGDRGPLPYSPLQYHDAETSWVIVDHQLRVQDRATGAPGPAGAPGFVRGVLDGRTSYFPVPGSAAASSPVAGVVDGQYGARYVAPRPATIADDDDQDAIEAEEVRQTTFVTLGGDRFEGVFHEGTTAHLPSLLVRWPAREGLRPVHEDSRWRSGGYVTRTLVGDPEHRRVSLHQELTTVRTPPLTFWHFLKPRDEASSRALAAITLDDAAKLLTADPAGSRPGSLLKGVKDPVVHAGVAAHVGVAREAAKRLEALQKARATGGVARPKAVATLRDEDVAPLFQNLRHYYTYGSGVVSAAIDTLGRFLRDGESGEQILSSRLEIDEWIGRIRAIAVAGARPELTDAQRATVAKLLRTWADSGLADPVAIRSGTLGFARLDLPWVVTQKDSEGVVGPAQAWRHHEGAHRLYVFNVNDEGDDEHPGPWTARFVEAATDGAFPERPGCSVTQARPVSPGDREWLRAFADALGTRGAFGVDRGQVERFTEATGVTPTDAAVVLLGFPVELEKAEREALGLRHAEVKAACQRLRSTPLDKKLALLEARVDADPERAWDDARGVDRAIAIWGSLYGRTVALDEALLTLADKELGRQGAADVRLVANHTKWAALRSDTVTLLDDHGDPLKDDGAFGVAAARTIVTTVAWLSTHLPVGDPVRAELPEVVALARQRLQTQGLWFAGSRWYHYDEKSQKLARTWFDALPGRAEVVTKNADGDAVVHRKLVGAVAVTHTTHWTRTAFQWAALDPTSRDVLGTLSRMADQPADGLPTIDALVSDGFAALVARVADTPLAAGQWEQNPLLSAPEVVKQVAAKRGLSENAAALYLQLLVLLDVSKKSTIEWTGWSPKVYDAAMAELVAGKLVVEGKRARAGRDQFLPGGWHDAKEGPPYELWKRPLYGWEPKAERFPLGRPVPLEPLHTLFAKAWRRCESGDAPAFEEVRR